MIKISTQYRPCTVNVAHDWDMDETASSKMSNLVLPHFKPCVDEYLRAFSIRNEYKFDV